MKRVVIEDVDKVSAKSCVAKENVYLAHHENTFRVFVYDIGSDQLKPIATDTSTLTDKEDYFFYTVDGLLRCFCHPWEVYQFPDFRSAMQYYLEQTK